MRTLRNLLLGLLGAAVWPGYVALAAYAARQAPWPRSVAVPAATALGMLALAALAAGVVRRLFGPGGWAEDLLGMPLAVTRQVRRGALALVAAHVAVLLPAWLLSRGLLAPDGRPVAAPAVVRGLTLAFELVVFGVAAWAFRGRSPLVTWLADAPAHFVTLARYRRAGSAAVLGGVAGVIVLDAMGYSYSARRLSTGAAGSLVVAAVCWGVYRVLLRVIDEHAWRWVKVRQALSGRGEPADDGSEIPDDLAARLRRLSGYLAACCGLLGAAWVWDLDLALFRFMSEQPLWAVLPAGRGADGKDLEGVYVTVGDLTRALAIFALCGVVWRHLSTFFAVAVFPRLPDDPGIRFAVVTLCRYAVLGLGLLCGLSAVHLGVEKVGMVLAALGVGLGFGLQEVVSNFVCGIILLLERPIRVGDVVTVSGMSGKVDRINIRATTIINGDNQSLIVPNRAFITGDLINWTLKDKVVRVTIPVRAALGTDPDRVSELLLAIAREDPDVLRNPVPSALVEEMTDAGLAFKLHVHVPEPSLSGRVRHRLVGQILHGFQAEGIALPLPTQKLLVKPLDGASFHAPAPGPDPYRLDPASPTPPPPWSSTHPRPTPAPVEDCHRGVDE
jgi:potassium efflux system protein